MINYTATPDYYNDYLCHFNHNHDPRNGQFTTGPGGPVSSNAGKITKLKKKAAKANVKAARANKRAAQASNKFLHPFKAKKKDKLQTKAFKAQSQADALNAKLKKLEVKDKKMSDKEMKKASGSDFDGYSKKLGDISNKITDAAMNGDKKALEKYVKESMRIIDDNKKQKVKDLNKDIKKVYKVAGSDFDGDGDKVAKQKIDNEVKRARKTGMYNMEFLERNLDLDPVTEEQMTGKALDNAYKKFLEDELKRKSK